MANLLERRKNTKREPSRLRLSCSVLASIGEKREHWPSLKLYRVEVTSLSLLRLNSWFSEKADSTYCLLINESGQNMRSRSGRRSRIDMGQV